MTQDSFVEAIKLVCIDNVTRSTLERLERVSEHPRGLIASDAATWARSLSAADKSQLADILGAVARHSVHNFLCVLDGTLAVENAEDRGALLLVHRSGSGDTLLNDPSSEFLNAVLSSTFP